MKSDKLIESLKNYRSFQSKIQPLPLFWNLQPLFIVICVPIEEISIDSFLFTKMDQIVLFVVSISNIL